jgi:hypothetical protein
VPMTPSRSPRSRPAALPVLLLLGLIAFHGYQVVALEDDPQRGGAFAMFATIDIGATRKIIATSDDGQVQLELPAILADHASALLDRPTEEAATDFAESVRELAWAVEDGQATATNEGGVVFDQVRLQVVGFVADGRMITRRVMTDVVVGEAT